MAGNLAQRLKVPTAAGVIGQELDLRPARQTLSPFFETQDRERAHQADGIDLVYC
jgi:hypothetical protein